MNSLQHIVDEITALKSLAYLYSILNSPTFRSRYSSFLKIDYPRVPLPSSKNYFNLLSDYGEKLIDLHLFKNSKNWPWGDIRQQGNPSASPMAGSVGYDENSQEIIFDKSLKPAEQFRLGPVPKYVWEFRIGGYQVLQHWLAERKGMTINLSEFVPIIIALKETDRIMREEIDPAFCEMMGI